MTSEASLPGPAEVPCREGASGGFDVPGTSRAWRGGSERASEAACPRRGFERLALCPSTRARAAGRRCARCLRIRRSDAARSATARCARHGFVVREASGPRKAAESSVHPLRSPIRSESDKMRYVKFAFGSQGLDPGSCPLLPGCGFSRRVGTAFERIVQRLGRRTSHRTSHGDSGRVAGRRDGGPSGSQSPGAGSAPQALRIDRTPGRFSHPGAPG